MTTLRRVEYVDLTRVTETCKQLNHDKYSYSSFCGFFPAFATVVLARIANLKPFLAISLRSHLSLLSEYEKERKSVHFLGWDWSF